MLKFCNGILSNKMQKLTSDNIRGPSRTLLLSEADATTLPLGEKIRDRTQPI